MVVVDYSVLGDALRAAASVARAVGEAAGSVDLASPASEVGAALVGTDVVRAAAELVGAWDNQVAAWTHSATVHGEHLQDAAATYDRAEAAGTSELHRAGGG